MRHAKCLPPVAAQVKLSAERSASAAARSDVGCMLLLGGVLTVSGPIEITVGLGWHRHAR